MKKFEILQELPKCDTETQSEQISWKNGANRLAGHRIATNLQSVKKKNAISAKCNKTKNSKRRCAS